MGVRFPSVASTTFIGPLPANATEVIVLTTPPLNIPLDFAQVLIFWYFSIVCGTGTSGLQPHLRRGTTTGGTQINSGTGGIQATAGAAGTLSGFFVDTPGAVAGQQYSLGVAQIGATAAGVFEEGCVIAFAL